MPTALAVGVYPPDYGALKKHPHAGRRHCAGDEARGGVVDVSRGVAVLIDLLHFVASAGPPILLLALSTAQMLPACPPKGCIREGGCLIRVLDTRFTVLH